MSLTAPQADVAPAIRGMLADLTTVPAASILDSDRLGADLGLDSVAQMELVSMIAERLDLEVEMEDTFDVETVGDVVALVERHRHD